MIIAEEITEIIVETVLETVAEIGAGREVRTMLVGTIQMIKSPVMILSSWMK
jgi:hypothetical protein